MRLLIEEYKYNADDVRDVLRDIQDLEDLDGYVRINYVGYFYCTHKNIQDCVFILPKVLLEVVKDKNGVECERVFGKYRPEEIINIDKNDKLTPEEVAFIYEFAVWIYRAIVVFKLDKGNDTSIVYQKQIAQVGHHQRRLANTYLEVILELLRFNQENQNFFMFVLRNIHSGLNKINWTRTIAHSQAIVQDNSPIYLNPINKKRQINFDEELLVIFFSILNYINEHYGFKAKVNCNFDLIKGDQFKRYMNGYGKVRLQQIKYKYFSDKALRLWELCMAFFDMSKRVVVDMSHKEYLLVKNFNIVFEAMIDELIGDKDIPKGLKKQEDGKRVDHMYTYKGLTTHEEDKPIYYIGDSKYYKRGNPIGKESVYKQFTYARNVIQWNLDVFMNEDVDDADLMADKEHYGHVSKLRDEVTEGYNIIPNFFISAMMPEEGFSYTDAGLRVHDVGSPYHNLRQFENRLFDRDTLLVCHYDVNFLYVVSLYARNSAFQKDNWKNEVRKEFRKEIQKILKENYHFYAMEAHPDVDAKRYIQDNFQELLGKVFAPYANQNVYSLALNKDSKYGEDNEKLKAKLDQYFYVSDCEIGANPVVALDKEKVKSDGRSPMMGNDVLVAKVKEEAQMAWIKGSHKYNMPFNALAIAGGVMNARYVLLFMSGDKSKYYFCRVKKTTFDVMTQQQLLDEAVAFRTVDGKCYKPESCEGYLILPLHDHEIAIAPGKYINKDKLVSTWDDYKPYVMRSYADVMAALEE